jgi:hypothetical protein
LKWLQTVVENPEFLISHITALIWLPKTSIWTTVMFKGLIWNGTSPLHIAANPMNAVWLYRIPELLLKLTNLFFTYL